MKKFVSLLLAMLMLLSTVTSFAESPNIPSEGNYVEYHTDMQDFFIDILFSVDQPDDTILEFPVRIKAFTVTYKYEVYRDAETSYYSGFGYTPETFVTLAPVQLSEDGPNLIRFLLDSIDLTLTPVRNPDVYSFSGHGADYFTVEFTGGEFEITYHDRLDFSCYDGSLIDTTQKTEKLQYSFRSPE